ncbi:energy transducer TonB [Pontimicrobium sp. SW4]|uniref:Energy transducer TonB n=1 Tax=Pontimicrobium sp. SW4 TaxID=3153519 RepID=A0AAU7BP67_9FLAO
MMTKSILKSKYSLVFSTVFVMFMCLNLNAQDKLKNTAEFPYESIDEVPVFPGCENLSDNIERRKCLSDNIYKYVDDNLNTKLAKQLGFKGEMSIAVIFKINEEGTVTEVKSRAPHPELEKEAKRVISSIPKMIPAKRKGKGAVVPYSLPITFEVGKK